MRVFIFVHFTFVIILLIQQRQPYRCWERHIFFLYRVYSSCYSSGQLHPTRTRPPLHNNGTNIHLFITFQGSGRLWQILAALSRWAAPGPQKHCLSNSWWRESRHCWPHRRWQVIINGRHVSPGRAGNGTHWHWQATHGWDGPARFARGVDHHSPGASSIQV